MDEPKDKFNKPGFDARQHYYNILTGMIKSICQFSYEEDFRSWLKMVKQMAGLVSPFIEPDNKIILKEKIKKLDSLINVQSSCNGINNKSMLSANLSIDLQEVTDDIYNFAKHMLLPIKIENDGDYKSADFFGGSAL